MACRCRSSNCRQARARSSETSRRARFQALLATRPTRAAGSTSCASSPTARRSRCGGSDPVRRPSDSMARSPEKQRIPDEPAEKLRPSLLSEIQGMALRWFRRENPPEVWDARLERPTGDIEAAQRIRDICRSAAGSAEKISGLAGNLDSNRKKYEADRYEA